MNQRDLEDLELTPADTLRYKAEQRVLAAAANGTRPAANGDARALVHELEVHRIELEMQNEELQRAHAAAQEASEEYYELFDFAPMAYFVWDHEARILDVNLAGADLLTQNRKALVQKRFGQFVEEDDRAAFADFNRRLFATDMQQNCEIRLVKFGQPMYVLIEAIAAADRKGQGKHCCAAVIDITQQKRAKELAAANRALKIEIAARKQAEEALRQSQDRLAGIIGSAMDAIISVDASQTIVMFNSTAEKMFRCPQAEAVGQPLERFIPDRFRAAHSSHVRAFAEEDISNRAMGRLGSLSALRADGEEFPMEASISQVEVGGQKLFTVIVRDVTERRRAVEALARSEEQYRTLFTTMLEGFCIIEVLFDEGHRPVDCRLLEINPAFEGQTGLKDAKGKLMLELVPELEAHWMNIFARVALTGEAVRIVNEAKALHRWYDVHAYRIGGDDSRKVAILFIDITAARKRNVGMSLGAFRHDHEDGPAAGPQTPPVLPGNQPFKLDEALERFGGEAKLFREIVGFFFTDGQRLAREIRSAAEAGDAKGIAKKAERLKGTLMYLSAGPATVAVARIETLARSGDLSAAGPALGVMEKEIARLADALRSYGPDD